MKVVVSWMVRAEREVEIDDKFIKLTEEGGYEDLSYTEQDRLTSEMLTVIAQQIPGVNEHQIEDVETADGGEYLYEG